MEEESGKAIASPRIDDDGPIPPSKAGRPDLEGVDCADGYGKGVTTNGAAAGRNGGRRWDEVGLFRGRVAVAEVDLDVDALRVA